MRHRKAGSKLNRNSSHRKAMFRNMVTSLLKHDRIQTTDVRAKILRGWADHIITLAKRGDLHARRQALAIVREQNVVHKLFDEASDRFGAAGGGYTRITKLGYRPGDAARMAIIELIDHKETKGKKKNKKKATKQATPKAADENVAVKADDSEKADPAVSETKGDVSEVSADSPPDADSEAETPATDAGAAKDTKEDAPQAK